MEQNGKYAIDLENILIIKLQLDYIQWHLFINLLSNLFLQAESLVKAQQDIGETMGQLGLAFVKLTKFEADEALFNSQRVRSADMKNVATAAVKASRLYRELNAQTVKHLVSYWIIALL